MIVLFKVDITNDNKSISKDHGMMIHAGTEIQFDKVSDNVQRLVDLGVAEVKEEKKEEKAAPKKKK